MRIATLGFLAVLSAAPLSAAMAADLDYGYLRGSDDGYPAAAPLIDWSGFYVGGHGGYSSSSMGYKNVFQPSLAEYFRGAMVEVEYQVSTLLALPSRRVGSGSFGAFAGYNIQFDEFIAGVEVDYTALNQSTISTSDYIARQYILSSGMTEAVALVGTASTKIEDYGTFRGRIGYAFGNILPFVTAGVAVGRATITGGALAQHYQTVPNGPDTVGVHIKSKAVGGIALGAGLEYAITPNIILRGEYQYVLFDDFDGHKANINTVRGGAAIKF